MNLLKFVSMKTIVHMVKMVKSELFLDINDSNKKFFGEGLSEGGRIDVKKQKLQLYSWCTHWSFYAYIFL